MKNDHIPSNSELPSIGRLVKSTVLAICIAGIILVTIVLPAEYGIDPTGMGSFTGLVKMGEIKVSLADEASRDRVAGKVEKSGSTDGLNRSTEPDPQEQSTRSQSNILTDEMTISLAPNEGKEIKLTMAKGEQANYVWWTDGGRANFDAHADSKKLNINYHNYSKGTEQRSEGVLEAAFDGKHGWFWRNRTSESMTVTLQVSGEYSSIDRLN